MSMRHSFSSQVRMLLQDLTERRRGHRNVTEEQVDHALKTMDTDGDGLISAYEFTSFLSSTSLSNANIISWRSRED